MAPAPPAAPAPPLPSPPGDWESWDGPMRIALDHARAAAAAGEVPVGAVVLDPAGELIGQAHNTPITQNDPTAHAELLAMRQAAETLHNYRLTGCTIVVTLEPCLMCAAAMVHARVAGVVYGAADPRTGAVASQTQTFDLPYHNHRPWTAGGVLGQECGEVLRSFFRERRKG